MPSELRSTAPAPVEALPVVGVKGVSEQLDQTCGDGFVNGIVEHCDGDIVLSPDENTASDENPSSDVKEEIPFFGDQVVVDGSKTDEPSRNNAVQPENNNTSGWTTADVVPASAVQQASIKRRTFYIIRVPRFADNKLKNGIKLADLQMEDTSKKREFYRTALQLKRANKTELLEKLKLARERDRGCKDIIQEKRMEMEPYQTALNKFRNTTRTREKGQDLCSSEEELNERIAYHQHRIEHESIPLKEEKQLLREIKQLEATRGQVCANMASRAELIEIMGPKEEIQERYKLIGSNLDALRKVQRQAHAEVELIEKEIEVVNVALEELRHQVDKINLAQKAAYESRKELRGQENEQNAEFYKYKRDLQAFRTAISEKKLDVLEDLCHEQVERVFALWCNDTVFRTAYMTNNEASTLRRLETLDGRALGPDEEPPLLVKDRETHYGSKSTEQVNPQTRMKTMDRSKLFMLPDEESTRKLAKVIVSENCSEIKAPKELKKSEEKNPEAILPSNIPNDILHSNLVSQNDSSDDKARQETVAAELKEKRRQEEMAKAREAAERKRRLAEKNQNKALARAQKEAERKEKERAKKLRKRNDATVAAAAAAAEESNSSDATYIESHEPAEASEGVSVINQAKNAREDFNRGLQKRPLGKQLKVQRVVRPPVSKKKAQPFPTWLWLILAMLIVFFFIMVGVFWMKV